MTASNSKSRRIGFWVATALVAAAMAGSGLANLAGVEDVRASMAALGYPAYLMTFLGLAKLAGVVVIVLPRMQRLKEWAYAGLAFDLAGALYSHIANGDAASEAVPAAVLLGLTLTSYLLRPASRRLPDAR